MENKISIKDFHKIVKKVTHTSQEYQWFLYRSLRESMKGLWVGASPLSRNRPMTLWYYSMIYKRIQVFFIPFIMNLVTSTEYLVRSNIDNFIHFYLFCWVLRLISKYYFFFKNKRFDFRRVVTRYSVPQIISIEWYIRIYQWFLYRSLRESMNGLWVGASPLSRNRHMTLW